MVGEENLQTVHDPDAESAAIGIDKFADKSWSRANIVSCTENFIQAACTPRNNAATCTRASNINRDLRIA